LGAGAEKLRLSRRAEDYLRGIFQIIQRKGYARVRDVARQLGVQPSTATEMLKRLNQLGLVVYERYSGVTLTQRGEEIARAIQKRHETFKKFLEIILVPEDIAERDAHILEHQLDPKTILQFTRFVDFITKSTEHPRFVSRWLEQFRKYCEREERLKRI